MRDWAVANISASTMRGWGTAVVCQSDSGLMRDTRLRVRGSFFSVTLFHIEAAIKERIGEQSRAAGAVAVDCTAAPELAARRLHLIPVEVNGDVARRPTGDVFAENATHDVGFGFDNDALTGLAWDRSVAIGQPAAGKPLAHSAGLPALHMHGKLFEVHGAHEAFQARVHLGNEAGSAGVNFNPFELHFLAQADRIGSIAGKAIDMLD